MSTVTLAEDVRLDPETHTYYRGLQKLVSVSKIIKTVMPTDYSAVAEDVLEHAKRRGILVDALFCQYLNGEPLRYPKGTPVDYVDSNGTRKSVMDEGRALIEKLIPFWDRLGIKGALAQVILADDDTAGTCDVLAGDWIFDLKCVSSLQPSYALQLGGYRALHGKPLNLAVIHVNKTLKEPRLVEYKAAECEVDFRCIREAYRVVQRRTA